MSYLTPTQKPFFLLLVILLAGCDDASSSSSSKQSEGKSSQVTHHKKAPVLKNINAYLPSEVFTDPDVIALAEAIRNSNQPEVEKLLAQGVDVNTKGKLNFTPFHFTMHCNDKKIFLLLLKHGANPNIRITQSGDCMTHLTAMIERDSDWLKMVLENGGDPNITDPVDMITTNETPLFKAIFGRSLENVKLLIDAGADINHQADNGGTPAIYAGVSMRFQMVYTLLQAGADWKIKNNYNQDLAFVCYLCPWIDQKDFPVEYEYKQKVFKFLEEKGVDLKQAKQAAYKHMGWDKNPLPMEETSPSASVKPDSDSKLMNIYVTPYYNSKGLQIDVGKYSQELKAATSETILDLTAKMQKERGTLTVESMYVTSIRLYDLGYKNESVYWFHSARFRAGLFKQALPKKLSGGIGSEDFDRYHAHYAFHSLAGEYINGYAFGDLEMMKTTIHEVKSESITLPKLQTIYPKIQFTDAKLWPENQKGIAEGLDKLLDYIDKNEDKIKAERKKNGIEDKY